MGGGAWPLLCLLVWGISEGRSEERAYYCGRGGVGFGGPIWSGLTGYCWTIGWAFSRDSMPFTKRVSMR